MRNFLQYKKVGLEKFELDADLLEFIKGRKLQRGQPWKKCKALYVPLNVKGCHWVALFIDIVKCQIIIFDSDVAATTKEEMGEHVRPFCAMLPLVLRMTNKFKHLSQHLTKAWTWRCPRNMCTQTHRSGDCGVYMLRMIEFHMMDLSLKEGLTDESMEYHRMQYAVELFNSSFDP
ncbi:hypothetical protein UlMin_013602 [Ulmus minor]